jgi:hypothetical protein
VERCVSMSEVRRVNILEVGRKMVQEFWSGRENLELKRVRGCLCKGQCQVVVLPKEREGMSEIGFGRQGCAVL